MAREILDIPLEQIVADPNQPRKHFDRQALNELAESIRQHGLLQPILVRPNGDGTFEIVHGERRYRAHKKLCSSTIRCIVRGLSDREAADIRIVENIERDNLTDIELAWEFERRVNQGQTHEEIAAVIGRKRAFVTQRLALLKLPREQQTRMLKGELSFSNARLLLSIRDADVREQVSGQIGKDTTVKEAISLVKAEKNVTRVTFTEGREECVSVEVKSLAVYRLFKTREEASIAELVAAYVQDLKKFRGSVLNA